MLIDTSLEGRILSISLNNPPLNVINIALMREFMGILKQYKPSRDINAVLIRGAGKCFSAGADIKEHLPGQAGAMINCFRDLLIDLITYPKITVASIHGYTMGGGFELALAADFCLARKDARVSLPEIKLGVFPPVATAWLPLLVGFRNANKLNLTACELAPDVLKEMGLVNHVLEESEFEKASLDFCGKFSDFSMPALAHAKSSMGAYRRMLIDALNESAGEYLTKLMSKHDPVEGLTSFMEKRKPVWKHS